MPGFLLCARPLLLVHLPALPLSSSSPPPPRLLLLSGLISPPYPIRSYHNIVLIHYTPFSHTHTHMWHIHYTQHRHTHTTPLRTGTPHRHSHTHTQLVRLWLLLCTSRSFAATCAHSIVMHSSCPHNTHLIVTYNSLSHTALSGATLGRHTHIHTYTRAHTHTPVSHSQHCHILIQTTL